MSNGPKREPRGSPSATAAARSWLLGALVGLGVSASFPAQAERHSSVPAERLWADWCASTLYLTTKDLRIRNSMKMYGGGREFPEGEAYLDVDGRPELQEIQPMPAARGRVSCWLAPQGQAPCWVELDGRVFNFGFDDGPEGEPSAPAIGWLVEPRASNTLVIVAVRDTRTATLTETHVVITAPPAREAGSPASTSPGHPMPPACPGAAPSTPRAASASPPHSAPPPPPCLFGPGVQTTVLVWLEAGAGVDEAGRRRAETTAGRLLEEAGVRVFEREAVRERLGIEDAYAITAAAAKNAGLHFVLVGSVAAWGGDGIANTDRLSATGAANLRLLDVARGQLIGLRGTAKMGAGRDEGQARRSALERAVPKTTEALLKDSRANLCGGTTP